MQHYRMADCHATPDDRRKRPLRNVNDCSVLNIRALAYSNVITIASQHAIEPNARVIANVNVADDMSAFCDESCLGNLRRDPFVRTNHD